MKKRSQVVFLLFLSFAVLYARPVTPDEVRTVVSNWLSYNPHPLSESFMGTDIDKITTYKDDEEKPLYYIVDLQPSGYVIVAGDDMVEPIIGFSGSGHYRDSDDNPLSVLVKSDVPGRVKYERELEEKRINGDIEYDASSSINKAKKKWQHLFNLETEMEYADAAEDDDNIETGLNEVEDVRVAPLLQTKWSQQKERGGHKCYNLYTPHNYPSGCVATAFGQILRYFEYPTRGVGTASYDIKVDGNSQKKKLLGGDGRGGAYDWENMTDGPRVDSAESRRAIGRLLNDTGVSVHMQYTSGGSGARTTAIADALKGTFFYENAVKAYDHNGIETADFIKMINPNLDAGLPVALGIHRDHGGHAVVTDGYGYDQGTLYNHVNMGWSGSYNAWYNLPHVDAGNHNYTSIHNIVYNIYTQGNGEIISGRVTDKSGNPIANATVTAKSGSQTFRAKTNAKGIYALVHLPSNTSYTITVKKSGYAFDNKRKTTGESKDYKSVGNVWGVDFVGKDPNPTPATNASMISLINYLLGG